MTCTAEQVKAAREAALERAFTNLFSKFLRRAARPGFNHQGKHKFSASARVNLANGVGLEAVYLEFTGSQVKSREYGMHIEEAASVALQAHGERLDLSSLRESDDVVRNQPLVIFGNDWSSDSSVSVRTLNATLTIKFRAVIVPTLIFQARR